ncbi:AraC-like DNA-binding protein [Paenibacillus sp. V4I7]|nr:AraC-like DNA-binding protein [Paenibacillus sp. V4I7]MDQ0916977.1 AraC-like DNA-binding protein [Paenibacillus sp. V4I5]
MFNNQMGGGEDEVIRRLGTRFKAGFPFMNGSRRMHYRKIWAIILLITGIPGLITGLLIYWFAGGRIENEMVSLHKNQIVRRAESINSQFDNLELFLSHWAFDPKFGFALKEVDFYRNFQVTNDISKTLVIMQGSLPLIDKIEFYVNGSIPVLFHPNFNRMDPDSMDWLHTMELMRKGSSVYWTLMPSLASSGNPDLTIVHKMPGGASEPFALLRVHIDHDEVLNLLKTLTPYEGGEAFLMQEDGTVLVSTGSGDTSPLMEAMKKNVKTFKGKNQTSFLMEWDHVTYSVSFGGLDRIGAQWIYVSAAPINAITKPVVFLSKLIIMISCTVLLLALLLASIASRKIYSPLDRLVRLLTSGTPPSAGGREDEFTLIEKEWQNLTRESLALQSKLQNQLPHVQQGFLYQLTQGYLSSYSEEELRERMRQYGWMVDKRSYRVLYIQLTGMAHVGKTGRYSLGDEGLVTFAAANVVEEMAREQFEESHVINFHDLTMGLLLSIPSGEDAYSDIDELGNTLIQAINRILEMKVTLSVGRISEQVKQIPLLFEETKLALSFRGIYDENQIIDLAALKSNVQESGFQYPFTLEREIIQAMRTGKLDEAEQHIQAFLEALVLERAKELDVQTCVLNLLGSLEHTIMQSGLNPNQLFKSVNRFEQLSVIREPEQIKRWFVDKIIHPFMTEMEHRSDYKLKKVIEQAMTFINAHYMKDISLDDCAEHCTTNVFVLSRTFKQVSGKNFIDYLTELRMSKAKALLRDSERRINDIAEQVGYQHSYFNRLFKKYEGVTPSQYRETSRNA